MELHRNEHAVKDLIRRKENEGKVKFHDDFPGDRSMRQFYVARLAEKVCLGTVSLFWELRLLLNNPIFGKTSTRIACLFEWMAL